MKKKHEIKMQWIRVKDLEPKDQFKHHEPVPDVLVFTKWGMKIATQ